jgi:adenylate cyclase
MLANLPDFREDGAMDDALTPLLEGLAGPERSAREQLLRKLVDDGFTTEQLVAAARENRLALLPVERALGGSFTAAEVEAQGGPPAEVVLRMRRLMGLPQAAADEPVFSEVDLAAARSMARSFQAGVSPAAMADITRVLGESMSRLAATVSAGFAESLLRPGDSEDAVALRFAELAETLLPDMTPVLAAAFASHLHEAVGRGMIGRSELELGSIAGAQEMGVCFADLVGFTRLGGELEAQELGSVAGQLGALASEVASGPVRLVKTIGDAAMFASRDAAALTEAALKLVAAAHDADLPSLRAGIAYGPALQQSGDLYGHTVNLASRVTGAARPDSVLCTEEVRELAGDAIHFSAAGHFRLKGVQRPVAVYRARLAEPVTEGDDAEAPSEPSERSSRRRPRGDRSRR